jgi:hypothetical protein
MPNYSSINLNTRFHYELKTIMEIDDRDNNLKEREIRNKNQNTDKYDSKYEKNEKYEKNNKYDKSDRYSNVENIKCKICRYFIQEEIEKLECTKCKSYFHIICLGKFAYSNPIICPECQIRIMNPYVSIKEIYYFEDIDNEKKKIHRFQDKEEKEEKFYTNFDEIQNLYKKPDSLYMIYCLKGGTENKDNPIKHFNTKWPFNFKITVVWHNNKTNVKLYSDLLVKNQSNDWEDRNLPIMIFPDKFHYTKNDKFSIFKHFHKNIFFFDQLKYKKITSHSKHEQTFIRNDYDKYDIRISSKINKRDPADLDDYYIVLCEVKVQVYNEILKSIEIKDHKFVKAKLSDKLIQSESFSLKDDLSCKYMKYPGRGEFCKHYMCFCIETFIFLNTKKFKFLCSICKLPLGKFYIDGLFNNKLKGTNSEDVKRISIHGPVTDITLSGDYEITETIYEDGFVDKTEMTFEEVYKIFDPKDVKESKEIRVNNENTKEKEINAWAEDIALKYDKSDSEDEVKNKKEINLSSLKNNKKETKLELANNKNNQKTTKTGKTYTYDAYYSLIDECNDTNETSGINNSGNNIVDTNSISNKSNNIINNKSNKSLAVGKDDSFNNYYNTNIYNIHIYDSHGNKIIEDPNQNKSLINKNIEKPNEEFRKPSNNNTFYNCEDSVVNLSKIGIKLPEEIDLTKEDTGIDIGTMLNELGEMELTTHDKEIMEFFLRNTEYGVDENDLFSSMFQAYYFP